MSRILGVDVGTNSLGLTVRDDSLSKNPIEQIIYSSVSLFKSGVGKGDKGEFSLASQRTNFKSGRKIHKKRRYRKWETLKYLIEFGLCPLTMSELERWRKYDKNITERRLYPIDSYPFQQWIKLDFNMDGVPDYSSPYEIRNELATIQLNLNDIENRYKLGRAMYHIAERRGFKSSKGEKLKDQSDDFDAEETSCKESEQAINQKLLEYKNLKQLPTVGCALYSLINEGVRVRGSEFQAIRKDYMDEIRYIFNFQNHLSVNSELFEHLSSNKKNVGSIFYKSPLKSQKVTVGKCTLEPSKARCPESRPEYEEFRAWSFINSINPTLTPNNFFRKFLGVIFDVCTCF